MFGKNKKPLIILLTFTFWIVYSGFTAFQFYSQASRQTEHYLMNRQSNLDFVLQSNVSSLLQTHPDDLQDKLAQARKRGLIDFYILQDGSEPVFFANNSGRLEDLNHNYVNFNQLIETNGLKFKTIKIMDFRLTAGFYADKNEILLQTFNGLLPLFLKDVGMVTILLSLVAFFVLKDIINISRILSTRSRTNLTQIQAQSREADTLLKGALSLEAEKMRLQNVSEIYGATVGPAIRHELKSDQTAPYSFTATMCRVDLNGYTQIFFKNDSSYLQKILNAYFSRAREIISRYNGLIYQFVGDEIVFEFKDDMSDPAKSHVLAISCLRDLFKEAEKIEKDLPVGANHYFKLKGSLAHGQVNFVALDQGHALSGLPLIESVRLLSLIDEKEYQLLAFFEDVAKEVENLALVLKTQRNHLKGFKEESNICFVKDFISLEQVLADCQWSLLTYFRSDDHLKEVFLHLGELCLKGESENLLGILTGVKFHSTSLVPAELVEICGETLAHFVRSDSQGIISAKSLASLVSLIGRTIPQNQLQGSLRRQLENLLYHTNFRVQSNAMVAMGAHQVSTTELYNKMFSESNRVSADAIIEAAKIEVSSEVVDALRRLLQSDVDVFNRSGQFAIRQIVGYYHKVDPVFLKTNSHLLQIQQWQQEPKAS